MPDDDLSPPRRPRNDEDDLTPPRKPRNDRDISPPRKKKNEDISPPRKSRKNEDISPPRKSRNSDISPPRKSKNNEDSPPRRSKNNEDSPPRRSRNNDDISPPRKQGEDNKQNDRKRPGEELTNPKGDKRPKIEQSQEAKKAGLFTAAEITKQDNDLRKKMAEDRKKIDPKTAGKGAETIYRDKHGRPLTMLNKMVGIAQVDDDSNYEWGVGKVDREAEEERKRLEEEDKGTSYRGVTFKEEAQKDIHKDVLRFGDPMLNMLSKKKRTKRDKRVYKGYYLPNRFGIPPGSEWDGIDRSNGYEAKLVKEQNEKIAQDEIMLKWSQADM